MENAQSEKLTEKLQKAGVSKPEETSSEIPPKVPHDTTNLLSLLESVLLTPFLNLLKVYLKASNGNNKTLTNCVQDFRRKHPKIFKLFFNGDLVCRFFFVVVVIIVVLRGLGIPEYIRSFFITPK